MTSSRFNLRTLLALMTVAAVVAVLGGPAFGGRAAAAGLSIAVASVLAALLVQGLFYTLCTAFLGILGAEEVIARTSRGGVQRGAAPTKSSIAAEATPAPESRP